jgi:hypothetical protein
MVQSVLGSLIMGYRPLWGPARSLVGIQLYVRAEGAVQVDALHLLRTLQELWSASSPPLLLAPRSRQLLCDLLEHAPRGTLDSVLATGCGLRVFAMCRRRTGADSLVWRRGATAGPEVAAALASLFGLRRKSGCSAAGIAPARPGTPPRRMAPTGARRPDENIANRALMGVPGRHHALALAGWPTGMCSTACGTTDATLACHHPQTAKAIDAEQSLETFEEIMGEDPLLAYRFMVYTNSAALGLRTGIDSLRRGLVMMGYGSIKRWLSDQLPHASTDLNLRPVRESMLIRAQLMTHLLDAGVENDLRREIYLCGLLSQLDDVMGESLGTILRRIPLSERIYDANVLGTGPYVSGLQMARALESEDAGAIRKLCETHEMDLEEVNRALLRVLADLEVERPAA